MPRRQARPGWLWSAPASGSRGRIWGASAARTGLDRLLPAGTLKCGQPTGRRILLLIICGLFSVQLTAILTSPIPHHGPVLGAALAASGALFGLQVVNSTPGAARWPRWRRLGVLLAQALITYLPLLILGAEWAGMAGFLAGSTLVLMTGRATWALFAVVLASMLLASVALGLGAPSAALLTIASLGIGLTVFGISRLALLLRQAHGANAQLVLLAAVRERERFSRDLHDLLGYSLSAITLKTEVARRLVGSDPAQAGDELAEVVDLARQAAADVRLVASGYRNISLAKEAASAASLLSAAGIAARVEIGCGALDDRVDTVLATVLREAVTNVLRHSAARNCCIEASQDDEAVTLAVTNDGLSRRAASHPDGYGLENLAWRLEGVGGGLRATAGDGRFSLLAKVDIQGTAACAGQKRPSWHALSRQRSPSRPGRISGRRRS